jgi:hypothetical protein
MVSLHCVFIYSIVLLLSCPESTLKPKVATASVQGCELRSATSPRFSFFSIRFVISFLRCSFMTPVVAHGLKDSCSTNTNRCIRADATIASQATGAMSWAFITAMKKNPQQSYVQLLNSIRDELATKYSQKPQLSCSHPLSTPHQVSLASCY